MLRCCYRLFSTAAPKKSSLMKLAIDQIPGAFLRAARARRALPATCR